MVFRGFDLQAEISYRTIDTENYQWKRFTAPVYGGQYPRGTTRWEQECLDTANAFLEKLFSVHGFLEFFIKNNCRLRKQEVIDYLAQNCPTLVFPDSREYRQPFTWYWCQLEGNRDAPGHIMDMSGWFYDKLAVPDITVKVDGKEYRPFADGENCFSSCVDDNSFAWKLCEASSYNVPYLYNLIKACDHNIEWLYEGSFTTDMDDGLYAVLELFDRSILPRYNVIVKEDTIAVRAGTYTMHIVDTSEENLRSIVKKNKKLINNLIDTMNK